MKILILLNKIVLSLLVVLWAYYVLLIHLSI